MKTGFFYDPIFLHHDTGDHPENAGRLRAILGRIQEDDLLSRLIEKSTRPATQQEVALIHDVEYLRIVEEAALSGRPFLNSPDCALSEQSYDAALNGAGAMVDAVLEVAEGKLDNAFVACRPPGHHAEHGAAMGFCFFNNIAIGAAWLTANMGYERVLIFDFDVHHGNGTQHAFESRNDILFASMHQDPLTCYPGTGFTGERGNGDGLGYTINLPMPPYATDADYMSLFRDQLLPRFREYDPQFILISAGFDAHRDDPLAQIALTQNGFDQMLTEIKTLALNHCQGRLVTILEGGYHYQRLAECVASHVALLQADPT